MSLPDAPVNLKALAPPDVDVYLHAAFF